MAQLEHVHPYERSLLEQITELWRARDVLRAFTARFLLSRHRQTVFGVGWALLQSLSVGALAALILAPYISLPHLPGGSYLLLVLAGVVPWSYFSRAWAAGVTSLVEEQTFFGRVYFPREILPLSRVLAGLADLAPALLVLLVAAVASGNPPTLAWLALPLPLVTLVVFTAACSFAPSAINVLWRDVALAVPFIVQLGFFAVPVLYPLAVIPDALQDPWAVVNPVVEVIESLRRIVLEGEPPEAGRALAALAFACAAALGSYRWMKRLEPRLADHL